MELPNSAQSLLGSPAVVAAMAQQSRAFAVSVSGVRQADTTHRFAAKFQTFQNLLDLSEILGVSVLFGSFLQFLTVSVSCGSPSYFAGKPQWRWTCSRESFLFGG